jgi:hypothetical protein
MILKQLTQRCRPTATVCVRQFDDTVSLGRIETMVCTHDVKVSSATPGKDLRGGRDGATGTRWGEVNLSDGPIVIIRV